MNTSMNTFMIICVWSRFLEGLQPQRLFGYPPHSKQSAFACSAENKAEDVMSKIDFLLDRHRGIDKSNGKIGQEAEREMDSV